ncbi:MAG: ABC transporter permease [Rubellimicrobium sp.]|nr:ABC transporter permease [Rubellimicrobium sp.]
MKGALGPVLAVIVALVALWYLACVPMNVRDTLTAAERAGAVITPEGARARQEAGTWSLVLNNLGALGGSWSVERPALPSPQQIAAEFYESTIAEELFSRRGIVESGHWSNRSLVYHTGVTLAATVAGFLIGAGLGIALAIGIVYNRAMDLSVMPWAVISQTVPIVALAPMIIVVANSMGVQGLMPKAIISAYLSFFPVVVGMVKGLRAPDSMQLDQMRTWNASGPQQFWNLRLPASVPYLFASLKVGIAASLVGTIVGELPVQRGGLGAQIFSASYYGQTAKIWAALLVAAVIAALLVALIGWIERRLGRIMGAPA